MQNQSITSNFSQRIQKLEARSQKFSFWRFLVFGLSFIFGLAAEQMKAPAWVHGVTVVGFFGFAVLVVIHQKVKATLILFRQREKLGFTLSSISNLDWKNIPELPLAEVEKLSTGLPHYFQDLDLLKGHSILRLVNHCVSSSGFARLVNYFSSNSISSAEILHRQKLVQEATKLRVLRRKLLVIAGLTRGEILSDRLQSLLESPFSDSKGWSWFFLMFFLQTTGIALFFLSYFYAFPPLYTVAILAVLILYRWAMQKVQILTAYHHAVALEHSLEKLAAISKVLGRISNTQLPELRSLLHPFHGKRNPVPRIRSLDKIIGALGVRQNYLLHLAFHLFFPWDLFWTLRLESLREELKQELPHWLSAMSEMEVLISLAEFEAANPNHVVPEIIEEGDCFLFAKELSHPLLSHFSRIGNDLELNTKERNLVITGSNMSGKSTYLRAIGVNLLLAKAGTTVSASVFRFKNLDLMTSLRLADSLEDGLSSFYAEVRQLKSILDKAESKTPVLYLIDEILRGTNNRERLIGSRAYISRLTKSAACGLITTHDLELAQLAEIEPSIRNYHFREDIDAGKMRFSYKRASGPCPTTNALKVMELAGLPIE